MVRDDLQDLTGSADALLQMASVEGCIGFGFQAMKAGETEFFGAGIGIGVAFQYRSGSFIIVSSSEDSRSRVADEKIRGSSSFLPDGSGFVQ
jgi:hypothetical protein